MRRDPAPQSSLFSPRVLLAFIVCSVGVLLAMFSLAATPLTETTPRVPSDFANFLSTVDVNANSLPPGVPLPSGAQFSVIGKGDSTRSSPTEGFAGMALRPETANRAAAMENQVSASLSWREIDVGTPTLFDAMAYDEARQQLVLFAGDAYNFTWIWNGAGWTKPNPPTSPGQRLGERMAYDPNTQTVIMFGGNDLTKGLLDETWSWNGTTWVQLHPPHSPSKRYAPGLVLDRAENKLVLFGGLAPNPLNQSVDVSQADTWTWDGNDWTQQITNVGPSPRFWPGMAYDPDTSSVVLFGGHSDVPGGDVNDTWTRTAAGWSLQTPTTAPPARGLTDIAYSPISHRVVLFGGIDLPLPSMVDGLTWEWDGTNWSSQQVTPGPGPRYYNSLALDEASGNVVLQGGSNAVGLPFGETWTWNGSAWSQVPERVPGKRYRGAMALDSTHRTTLLFGGLSNTEGYLGDTWTFDGTVWTELKPPISPSNRIDASLADNPGQRNAVLFGGQDANGYSNETWTWDGAAWILQNPAIAPPPRWGAAMAYDAQNGRVILFGGNNGGVLSDTWAWDGQNWTELHPGSSPSARWDAGLARDANGHLVLFGGALASGVAGDTWTWDGANWLQQSPATSPPPRRLGPLGYSPQLGAVILFGGFDASGSKLFDGWKWDGATGLLASSSNRPGARNGHALSEGPNGDVILFGDSDRNDTWSFGVLPVQLTSVVSRKTHGNAGIFDIDLPIASRPGIESRSGGTTGDHHVVFTFPTAVTVSSGSVTPASGQTAETDGPPVTSTDGKEVTLNLKNVSNAQIVTVKLLGVSDGTNTNDISVQMAVLLGDTTGDGVVDSGDITQVRRQSGQVTAESNKRIDVSVDGVINSADITLVRRQSGTALP